MPGPTPRDKARQFLKVADLYKLGFLPTEHPHPETRDLSFWAKDDLPRAVSVLKNVDLRAVEAIRTRAADIDHLAGRIETTLASGRRVFLCGCGATGRLSLCLEALWRQQHAGSGQVRAFMAGGDVALVQALEGFEDHPEYGARHLEEMGFQDGDLLIAATEGGETPYVIGAVQRAAGISSNPPWFLYCNEDSVIAPRIERFRRVHENPRIRKLCLATGPMALAGSTRMQASTVLQLAIGAALLHPGKPAMDVLRGLAHRMRKTDYSFLVDFVKMESDIYSAGNYVTYCVRDYGITVFTDTTERAPTFSLAPFERFEDRGTLPSLCYVSMDETVGPQDAWMRLLHRAPLTLEWPEIDSRTTRGYLGGFDFSASARQRRRHRIPGAAHHEFRIREANGGIECRLAGLRHTVATHDLPLLGRHLLLKQMLNIHSTLVMGRLGRYRGNLMTWVRPTNCKLVDRAARYVQLSMAGSGTGPEDYDVIVHQLFAEMDGLEEGESVVLRTRRSLMRQRRAV